MSSVALTDFQEELLDEMRQKWEAADAVHKPCRQRWDRLDRLYHSRRDLLAAHAGASPRDRDSVVQDARKEFGADLRIPYVFSVIETILPRMLSNRPRMIFTARNPASEKNIDNVRVVMDAQQHKSDYELKLQTTGRTGLHLGLGVQKLVWRHEEKKAKRLAPQTYDGSKYAVQEYNCVVWDDPDVQDISPYDFLWDPYGDSMQTLGWAFHRSWRSRPYVLHKLASGQWDQLPELDVEDVEGTSGRQQYTEVWSARWNAQGRHLDLKEPVHEVWEFHDGRRVITILDRTWPVAVAENPAWHSRMPFHIWRPTEVLHEFCGKSEIEPIEDLSDEMNALRSDRRWNALMKMNPPTFYEEGTLDPTDVRTGPGMMNPVAASANGLSLREMIHTQQVGDIPNSGYQEEMALQADIERVSGISESTIGAGGGEETATGHQLKLAAAGLRIQFKTRRLELELIKPSAEDWLALNQQRITEVRDVPVPSTPQIGEPERRYTWRKIGPEQLAGEFDVEPDGGSTAPENIPQMRQDAQMLMSVAQAPGIDQRKMLLLILEKFGVKAPETLLAPEVHVPPATLDLIAQQLAQAGMPAEMVNQLISGALNAALEAEDPAAQGAAPPPSEAEQPPEAERAAGNLPPEEQ